MSQKGLKKLGFEASACLVNAIQDARNAKRQYKEEMFSNRLAYEIGARILLSINDEEEEAVLDQKIAALEIQQSLINNQKQFLLEKKDRCRAEKRKREEENLKNKQEIESLASKIVECWEKITVLKQHDCIRYILNAFPGKLTRGNLSAVFPDEPAPIPSRENILKIAADLLRSEAQ